MFEKPTFIVGVSQRVVATLVACALLAATAAFHTAQAANLTDISDTLSTSEPSVTSAHTIAFTIPTGSSLGTGDAITIDFGGNFTGVNTVVGGDVTLTVNGGAATFSGFAAGANTISFTSDTAATAGQEVTVAIADGKITNPATIQSYEIIVDTGTGGDQGRTRVAIVNTVLVTAVVPTVFDFTITGIATGTVVNGETTTGSTTATAIDFAELVADTPEVLAQRLNVTTNARNGFVVTVEADGDLKSSTGAIIDSFSDGTWINTPSNWAAPGDALLDETTWGHWGLTSSDADLNGNEFNVGAGGDSFIAATTSPRVIFSHASSSDGIANNSGSTSVAYKIEITPLQEAADDYNTTLTYIATPTF